jgi:hypothetical protein
VPLARAFSAVVFEKVLNVRIALVAIYHFGMISDASGTDGKVSTGLPRSLIFLQMHARPKFYSLFESELPK